MKRILGLLLIFAELMCMVVFANTDDSRWKEYASSDVKRYYWDVQTLKYDAATNKALLWTKATWKYNNPSEKYLPGDLPETELYQITIDFNTKEDQEIQCVYYFKNGISKLEQSNQPPYFIYPDSFLERLADEVADRLGIPHLFQNLSPRWKWVKSTDTHSIYILNQAPVYDENSKSYKVHCKMIWPNAYHKVGFNSYDCNFDEGTIKSYINGKYIYHIPIPDTEEEAIYNAAYALFKENQK